MNEFQPHKAEKSAVKLKIAVQGPSGSGKTWGALALAYNLWPKGKICLIDTENESASLYADRWNFDTIPLHEPFTTDRYIQAINTVIDGGYDVVIIDSITPQWDGVGGILRRKEELDKRPGSNSYANWASFTPEHEAFKQKLIQSPIHLVATMRSKQEYALQADDKGKMKPVKLGLAPIQRDGMDFEFSQVWDVQMDHKAMLSKNRTGLFEGELVDLGDPKIAERLRAWLESGKVVEKPTVPASTTKTTSGSETGTSTPSTTTAGVPDGTQVMMDRAKELHTLADIGHGGVNKDQLQAFLKEIGYQPQFEGGKPVNTWLAAIRQGKYDDLKAWILKNKK